jgi:anti-sigma B factor antagonist
MSGPGENGWPFRFEVVPDGDSVAIRLHGELDIASVPDVDAAFTDVAERRVPIVLDLRRLTFMDSRGIRMLVAFQEQAHANGFPLTITCGDRVHRLLSLTGLDRHFTVIELPGE